MDRSDIIKLFEEYCGDTIENIHQGKIFNISDMIEFASMVNQNADKLN